MSVLFISKKELLKECKISNGQLLRWKQEGIIPDEWFIKRPTMLGQQLFFPKAKIIKRIKTIKKLKKQYSLDELSKILMPGMSEKIFTMDEVKIVEEIDAEIMRIFAVELGKSKFTFIDLIIMTALSGVKDIVENQAVDIIKGLKDHIHKMRSGRYILVIMEMQEKYYAAICAELAGIFPDTRFNIVRRIKLSSISNLLKIKYNRSFNFGIDVETEDAFA